MVHGDTDPWRKKCESYGFLLAKSMIIMDSEIHRERMKPKNIYKNIGQDAWDYANDRVIKTGNGWNWNLINTQGGQPAEATSEFQPNLDDTLMRASPGARETVETIRVDPAASLTEANVVNYADYNADSEVLIKEYTLSKNLLEQAIASINSDNIQQLKEIPNESNINANAAFVF